jgi:hypothetical protein
MVARLTDWEESARGVRRLRNRLAKEEVEEVRVMYRFSAAKVTGDIGLVAARAIRTVLLAAPDAEGEAEAAAVPFAFSAATISLTQ